MVSHDHPEGLKGALATAHAIYLALQGHHVGTIRAEITTTYGYDLSRRVADIRSGYEYTETAQGSVPESLVCSLEATDYEDAIRNAVSLGGDADVTTRIEQPKTVETTSQATVPLKLYRTGDPMDSEEFSPDVTEVMLRFHRMSIEHLYRYRCCECDQWWSIADKFVEHVTCPQCHTRAVSWAHEKMP